MSTQRIMGIAATAGTANNISLIRRRKDRSDDLLTLRSGVKSIALQSTICEKLSGQFLDLIVMNH
jgi:hypothetical protein